MLVAIDTVSTEMYIAHEARVAALTGVDVDTPNIPTGIGANLPTDLTGDDTPAHASATPDLAGPATPDITGPATPIITGPATPDLSTPTPVTSPPVGASAARMRVTTRATPVSRKRRAPLVDESATPDMVELSCAGNLWHLHDIYLVEIYDVVFI